MTNCLRFSNLFLQLQRVLGSGSYGVVCRAVEGGTGKFVAIKKISNILGADNSFALRVLRELALLRRLRGHDHIVNLVKVFTPSSTSGPLKNMYDFFLQAVRFFFTPNIVASSFSEKNFSQKTPHADILYLKTLDLT